MPTPTPSKIRLDRVLATTDPDDSLSPDDILHIEITSKTDFDFLKGMLSQFKQIIHGNHPGNWYDPVVSAFGGDASLYALYQAINGVGASILEIDCPADTEVGDWVYPTGPKVGTRFQGAPMDPAIPIKIPAFGIVREKISATVAKVQISGVIEGVVTGLIPHKIVYVGLDGKSTHTAPSLPNYIQPVGLGLDTGGLLVRPIWPELPLPLYASHLGTTDGTTDGHLAWPSGTLGRVAEPTTSGTPYYCFSSSGDLANPSVDHAGTRGTTFTIDTLGYITELDVGTTLRVYFYKYQSFGGNEVVIATESIVCNGADQNSFPNQHIQTIGVHANSGRFEGTLRVNVPLFSLLPNGGYIRAYVEHTSITPGFPYESNWEIFVDSPYNTPPIPGGIAAVEHTPLLTYLSGIRFYGLGTTFDLSGSALDVYSAMYRSDPVVVDFSQLGISGTTTIPYTDSGVTPPHPPTPKWTDGFSWLKTLGVNVAGFMNLNGLVRQQARDPFGTSGWNSSTSGFMVYTMPATSTDTDDRFDDENYRAAPKTLWTTAPACPPTGADKFVSTLPLDNGLYRGAQVYGGELIYPVTDFTTPASRRPVQQAGTNYSLLSGIRTFQRPYRHDTTPQSRSNVILYIPGFDVTTVGGVNPDIDPGGAGEINMWIMIPSVSTIWFDCGRTYFSSLFPSPEPGCLVQSLSGLAGGLPTNEYWYFTFGVMSTTLTDRMLILRIEYRSVPTKRFTRVQAFNWT